MRRATLLLTVALLALPGMRASAQTADIHVRAVLDGIEPSAPGVTLTIRNAPPAPPEFALRNTSAQQLEVTGYDFEPFVRLGRDGVYANRRSRTFYVTQDPTGGGRAPADARPGAQPVWVKLGTQSEWRWFEGRAVWRRAIPPTVVSANQTTTLGPWTVPAKLGGRSISIKGRLVWKPILGYIRARLLGVEPPIAGLEVRVLPGPIPAIVVTSTSVETVEIEGRDGKPFARISRRGVDVNVDDATARDNPRFVRESAHGWTHVQDTRVLSWLERRAAYAGEDPPGDPHRRAELLRWTIPLKLDDFQRAQISGVTEWSPFASAATPSKGASRVPLVLGVLLGVAIVGALIVLRARRHARTDARGDA